MKERPILFNGDMVRAILEGRKTQTRRVIKLNSAGRPQLKSHQWHIQDPEAVLACPYGQPGDRLWVRETWAEPIRGMAILKESIKGIEYNSKVKWRPSIHMPRWASRITLEITNVRVERLQDINEEDAKAEGLFSWSREEGGVAYYGKTISDVWETDPVKTFKRLWEEINGPGAWDKNPWVWVIEFKRI